MPAGTMSIWQLLYCLRDRWYFITSTHHVHVHMPLTVDWHIGGQLLGPLHLLAEKMVLYVQMGEIHNITRVEVKR